MSLNKANQLISFALTSFRKNISPVVTINRSFSNSIRRLNTTEGKGNILNEFPILKETAPVEKKSRKNKSKLDNDSSYSHVLNVHCSLNNTILTLCNSKDQVIATASSGTAGFKKAQRAGFEAAYQAAVQLVEKTKLKRQNVSELLVKFKGFGPGREAVFRSIRSNTDWPVARVTDTTPIPHNGCRPPKPRRL
ncbi:translational machinery component [Neoconidiobolus thromboides FSU 785]|nr:translational machinery component [Neoconidiobolus thromboides FSU 785]